MDGRYVDEVEDIVGFVIAEHIGSVVVDILEDVPELLIELLGALGTSCELGGFLECALKFGCGRTSFISFDPYGIR